MTTSQRYIAVDWGTTNRRAYLVGGDGEVIDRLKDARGVASIARADFPGAVAEIREHLGPWPILMAGMIGSNRGWVDVPYVDCPADLDALAAAACRADRDILIVPGVRVDTDDRADIMRGEEVQLLGAVAAGLLPVDASVCHPGTHAKWARLDHGAIADFRTVMTGEIFALLRDHSILASQLGLPATPGPAFAGGVKRSLVGSELLADLFGVRAMGVSGLLREEDAACYTSGLLIGADIRLGLDFVGAGSLALIGDPALTLLYAAALSEAGREFASIDGEEAFLAGMKVLARRLL